MYIHQGPAVYLTADRSRVVGEDDPAAAFLLVATGGQLPEAEAERYGLREEHPEPAPAEQDEKQAPAPANKRKSAPRNK